MSETLRKETKMITVLVIVGIILVLGWLALNVYVGLHYKVRNMRYALVEKQNLVGMIASNLFFWLAWVIQLGKAFWSVRHERTFAEVN